MSKERLFMRVAELSLCISSGILRNVFQMSVRGFFLDQRHLENMFRFLSKTSLIGPIEDRFIRQIDLMEAYLRETIQNADFYEFLEMIEQKCNIEYDGALHFKWINIIVLKLFELH